MFEWLNEEMAAIKTPKFHLVDGPVSGELRETVLASTLPISNAYKQFVLQFGNAKFFRQLSNYQLHIFAGPREAVWKKSGEDLIFFGFRDQARAYFKKALLVEGVEPCVFVQCGGGLRQIDANFEDWLKRNFKVARRHYKKDEWARILEGPEPFSDVEKEIVEARRKFRWRVVGVDSNGDMQFEVENRSSRFLPFLTIGVRHKGGKLSGGVWLSVGHIAPGKVAMVAHDCYKKHYAANEMEAFDETDPGPEDRDHYWEFRANG